MKKSKKYNYIYKITNNINGKYYIGVHSTDNLNDGYFGSGNAIKLAIKKYGKENFTKEILEFVNSEKEKYQRERELVTEEVVNDPQSYNMTVGGSGNTYGNINCKDNNGNIINVSKLDPRYLSGELKYMHKDKIPVRDKNGNLLSINRDDPRYLSGELVHVTKGTVRVIDKTGKIIRVQKDDKRIKNGELIIFKIKDLVTVRDRDGNTLSVKNNDPRYLSGELQAVNKGTTRVYNITDNSIKIIYPKEFSKYYPQYQFKFVCVALTSTTFKTLFMKDIPENMKITSCAANIEKFKIMLDSNIDLPDKQYFGKQSYSNVLKKLNP